VKDLVAPAPGRGLAGFGSVFGDTLPRGKLANCTFRCGREYGKRSDSPGGARKTAAPSRWAPSATRSREPRARPAARAKPACFRHRRPLAPRRSFPRLRDFGRSRRQACGPAARTACVSKAGHVPQAARSRPRRHAATVPASIAIPDAGKGGVGRGRCVTEKEEMATLITRRDEGPSPGSRCRHRRFSNRRK
jgi:hypothetical protein